MIYLIYNKVRVEHTVSAPVSEILQKETWALTGLYHRKLLAMSGIRKKEKEM
jgi:hypothetical protein